MKKNLTILMLTIVLSLFVASNLVAAESGDPTGNFEKLMEMEREHADTVANFLDTIQLDYHPDYGIIKKEALPCHAEGWDEKYVNELFPNGKVLSYKVKDLEVSGIVLAAHKARDGKIFYVWHRYEKEATVFVSADVEIDGEVQPQASMAFRLCSNGWWRSEDLVFYVDGIRVSWFVARMYLRFS